MILTNSKKEKFNVSDEIDNKIQSSRLNELLIIVPTNRKIRDLKKSIITAAPGMSSGKINLETIGTFSTKLFFNDPEIKGTILSEAASTVLLSQSIQELKLKYFSNYKGEIPSGTLERIKNVISEYKKHGITPETLRKECKILEGSEKTKAEDIADIYEKYQIKCNLLSVSEIGDVYYQLENFVQNKYSANFRNFFPDVSLVIVQGFDEFTIPEVEILNRTSEVNGIELFLSFDYYKFNPAIFSHLDNCYDKLEEKGFRQITDSSYSINNKFQSAVREKLFREKLTKKIQSYEGNVTRISAQSREEEIELVAKEIKDLITEQKVRPDEICLAFNLIQKYSPTIRDIFSVYKIPFNLTDRYSLNASPPVISIINVLEVLENDFFYKNILRALSGGYLETIGIHQLNLMRVSNELKIISGYLNWNNLINDAISQKFEEADEEFGNLSFKEENYRKALDDIETLHDLLKPFDKKMLLREFLDSFINLIYILKIPVRLVGQGGDRVEENVKAITVLIETVTELLELFKIEYGEKERFNLKFYLNYIRTAVNSTRYNIKERQGYGVQITTLSEIRGLEFDHLFIAGLCDGDLPTRYTPEIFFSPKYMKDEVRHHGEERYHFYQSLCSWKKRLYLVTPANEEKKELVESGFLTEFTSLFEVAQKSKKDYKDTLFSREEVIEFAGKNNIETLKDYKTLKEYDIDYSAIDDALKIDKQRIKEPFGASEFTGNIFKNLGDEAKEKLTEYGKRNFSISQLETYAKCPYKYFAERVLKLEPVEEPTEEIEALEMGNLLHTILYEFYSELNCKNIILQNAGEKDFEYAYKLIFRIAEEKIEKANFRSPLSFFEKEKVLGIKGERKNSLLLKFLIAERDNNDGFDPKYFEESFGQIGNANYNKSILTDFSVRDINISGKIDRIDFNEADKKYKVIDYKIGGRMPTARDLLGGISLQLPLYMYAAKKLIEAQISVDSDPSSAEIYSLKFSNSDFGRKPVKITDSRKKDMTEDEVIVANYDLIEICLDSIEKYVKSIANGKFNLSALKDRENKVCRYCDFRSICRIQEVN
jgi:ATP-dependent helicase/nuclease subunit B